MPGRLRGRGTAVNVILAGTEVKVPDLNGLKVAKADQQLAEAGLKLGKQNPRPNPNRPIVNQVPSAGEKRPTGTAVEVFLKQPEAGQPNADP